MGKRKPQALISAVVLSVCDYGRKSTKECKWYNDMVLWNLDTFASKVAAIQDEYADASVGNVTGSNAVNVFLGIGIAWTIAAFYHEYLVDTTGCVDKPGRICGKFNVDPGR